MMGAYLTAGLQQTAGRGIKDVRGLGLLIGIEFAEAERVRQFVAETIIRGVVINWTLNADRVVRLSPPLTLTSDEADFALHTMKGVLSSTFK
jgi:putrescine aminotransferase